MKRVLFTMTIDEAQARHLLAALLAKREAMRRLERTAQKAGIRTSAPTAAPPARPFSLPRFDEFERYAREKGYTANGTRAGKKGHRP